MSPEASADPIREAIMSVLSGFTRDCQVGLWAELVGPDSDVLRVIEGNMLLHWDAFFPCEEFGGMHHGAVRGDRGGGFQGAARALGQGGQVLWCTSFAVGWVGHRGA